MLFSLCEWSVARAECCALPELGIVGAEPIPTQAGHMPGAHEPAVQKSPPTCGPPALGSGARLVWKDWIR